MKVSIIILSWNTKELLRNCLKSVISSQPPTTRKDPIANHRPLATEIIVVDNGSTDGSPEMVKKEFSQVRLIRNRKNLGFAKGNNQGIKAATGDLIMLLNSDTVVKKGAIEKLATFAFERRRGCGRPTERRAPINQGDKIAAVSPLLLLLDGRSQIDYYMRFPNLWQIFLYHNRVFRPITLKIPFLRNLICFTPKKRPFEVDQLPGAALMATREAWEKVGLLDEDYRFLYEDVDWCWRAKKMGYRLIVIPEAEIVHLGGASWKKKLKEESFEFYHQFFSSMLLFVKKNYGELKFKIFKVALVVNFLLTAKLRLAAYFLKSEVKQEKLWR